MALASLGGEAQFIASYFGNGFDAKSLNEGLNTGQYEFSEGVNYGGQSPAQQTEFLRQELAPLLARPYRKVLFLDFHTGLGEDGVLAIIRGINPSVPLLAEAKTLLGARERDGIEFRSGQDPGFFPTAGDVIDFVPLLAPDPGKVLAVTMEYGTMGTGTLPQLRRAMRIILENQAHFHGCSKPPVCAAWNETFASCSIHPTRPGGSRLCRKRRSMTTPRERLVRIGAKIVRHGRSITFQMAEVMVSRPVPDHSGRHRGAPAVAGRATLRVGHTQPTWRPAGDVCAECRLVGRSVPHQAVIGCPEGFRPASRRSHRCWMPGSVSIVPLVTADLPFHRGNPAETVLVQE